jgi:uncharacterized membrane protein (UPF0127 family)
MPVSKILSLVVLALFVIGFVVLRITQATLGTASVAIHNHELRVLVADTSMQIYRGLGKRDSLGEYQGMLLVFGSSGRHGIVMREMRFPIDIVWINRGIVVDIAQAVPLENNPDGSLTPYFPREDANLVLELSAGSIEKYGLKIGDRVRKLEN